MTRAVALSDPSVIEEINEHFVPIEVNLTNQDFPAEFSGLSIWEEAYKRDSRYSVGFSTSVVLGSEGAIPFGTSGCGHQGELQTAINYDSEKFLAYLQQSRDRFLRSRQAHDENDPEKLDKIQLESAAQLREANICKCEIKKEIFPSDAR